MRFPKCKGGENMKRVWSAKSSYILLSVVIFLVGCVFLIWPGISLTVLARVMGAILLLSGIAKLFGYFSNDLYRIAFQFDLAFGILTAAAGMVILIFPQDAAEYLTVLLSIFVIVDALITVQNSIEARRFGIREWWLLLLGSIAAGVLGVAALVWPNAANLLLMRITGVALMLDGIQNIAVALLTISHRRH